MKAELTVHRVVEMNSGGLDRAAHYSITHPGVAVKPFAGLHRNVRYATINQVLLASEDGGSTWKALRVV